MVTQNLSLPEIYMRKWIKEMICSNCRHEICRHKICRHEENDHKGIGTTDMKCYGSEDWLCSCKKFEEKNEKMQILWIQRLRQIQTN